MKIENYGDMLSKAMGKKCIAYELFGSYQGDWVAVLEDGENIEFWKGYYGSCGGCDYLEGADYEVSEKELKNYFKEDKAFLIIPKVILNNITLKEFEQILPANIRSDIYDFDVKQMFNAVMKGKNDPK